MDIQMPEMDGVETTQHLRDLKVSLPPIIAMTAYAMKEDRDRFMANGMNDYVPKPIRAEILVRKVAEWVNKQLSIDNEQLIIKRLDSSVTLYELGIAPETLKIVNVGEVEKLPLTTYPSQLNNFKIIDPEIIKQLSDSVGGDMSFVASILEGFEEEATEQIKNAIEGYKNNNCKQVQEELHTLKGNAGTLGAMRLYEITRIIEEKAKYCDFQLFESETITLQEEFEKFKKELKTIEEKEKWR
jgi:HPt (histidine-containing phosphotransfer) domain-containing protein